MMADMKWAIADSIRALRPIGCLKGKEKNFALESSPVVVIFVWRQAHWFRARLLWCGPLVSGGSYSLLGNVPEIMSFHSQFLFPSLDFRVFEITYFLKYLGTEVKKIEENWKLLFDV